MIEEDKTRSFVFYESFQKTLEELPDDKALVFYRAICLYGLYGIMPDFTGLEKAVWIQMQYSIDVAKTRYNNCVENGKKGGRPKTDRKPKENQEETKEKPKENQEETNGKPEANLNDNVNDNVNVNVNEDADANDNVGVRVSDVENWFAKRGITLADQDIKKITTSLIIKQKPLIYLDYAFNYIKKKSYKARDGTLTSFNELPEANQRGMFLTAVSSWQDMEAGFEEWRKDYRPKAPDTCPKCGNKIQNRGGILCCTSCDGEVCLKDGRWILEPWMKGGILRVTMGKEHDG